MANMNSGNMKNIITSTAGLVPIKSLRMKKGGKPTASAAEKQMSCRLVRLSITFVLTLLKSLGIGT